MLDELLVGAEREAFADVAIAPIGQFLDACQLASPRPGLLGSLSTYMPGIPLIPFAKTLKISPPLAGGYRGFLLFLGMVKGLGLGRFVLGYLHRTRQVSRTV